MALPRVVGGVLTAAAVLVALLAIFVPNQLLDRLGENVNNIKDDRKCPLGYTEDSASDIQLPADHPQIIGRSSSNKVKSIFYNASVWTGNDNQPYAEAFAVNSNGYITAVGLSGEIMDNFQANYTEVVDLKGQFVVPGLIDAHVHLMSAGTKIETLNLGDIESKHEFMRTMEAVARHPNREGGWIIGSGWNEEKLGEFPDKIWLDAYIRRTPACMIRYDYHMILVNSVALQKANITKHTPDPPMGKIDRDEKGEPTGILRETATKLVYDQIPQPSEELKMRYFQNSQRIALQNGVTCVHDMAVGVSGAESENFAHLQQFYLPLAAQSQLKMRINMAVHLDHIDQLVQLVESQPAGYKLRHKSQKLFWGGLKVFSDGSLGTQTALFQQPYVSEDNPQTYGSQLVEWEELQTQIEAANEHGFQVMVHAIGDKAVEEVANVMAKVASKNISSIMNRIEHGQHISGQEVAKLISSSGVGITVNPQHMIGDFKMVQQLKDERLLRNTHAYSTLHQNGVKISLASDWPVVDLDPWVMLYNAIFRKQPQQDTIYAGDQGLDAQTALKGITYHAAQLAGVDDIVGRIIVGLKADFAVLDASPILLQQDQILPNTVMTFVDGVCEYGC